MTRKTVVPIFLGFMAVWAAIATVPAIARTALVPVNRHEGALIKNPAFTHVEAAVVYLKKVRTLIPNEKENYFLGFPTSMAADDQGNLYVYDNLGSRIYRFDKDLRFIQAIGSSGVTPGPGQFSAGAESNDVRIEFGKDGLLYASDLRQKKILCFNPDGKFIKDFPVNYIQCTTPLVDRQGNFYLPSIHSGIIDVYDPTLKLKKILLAVEELDSFLVFKPAPGIYRQRLFPYFSNYRAALLSGERLLVYNLNASKLYLVKNDEITLEKYLWPQNALALYRGKMAAAIKENPDVYRDLFIEFCQDLDNGRFFYLQFGKDEQRNLNLLYRFDIEGNLTRVLAVKIGKREQDRFKLKKGGRFFTIDDNKNINIFEEEVK